MRRMGKWLLWGTVLAVAAVLALVVFGGWQIKDGQGNVAFGWDAQRKRLRIAEQPVLGLDGPHAFSSRDGGYRIAWTERDGADWRMHERRAPARPAPALMVRVGNPSQSRFDVVLRPSPPVEDGFATSNPSRLLMLSDMEGEFDAFVALLRAQGVVDAQLHWRYGDGHLALVGDFVDRGRDMLPLLWLIYRLDGEARQAGGRVHYVLGNHEQFATSGRKKYWPRSLVASEAALGEPLFSQGSVLGAWLRSKPAIVRVGDHLLVHGGISAQFLDRDLDIPEANAAMRPHLGTPIAELPPAVVPILGRDGVTWYRGMALPDDPKYAREADPSAHLDRTLRRYGARRIAIGHTLVPRLRLQQQGRVLALNLDMHDPGAVAQAALYEHGRLWRVDAKGARERLE